MRDRRQNRANNQFTTLTFSAFAPFEHFPAGKTSFGAMPVQDTGFLTHINFSEIFTPLWMRT